MKKLKQSALTRKGKQDFTREVEVMGRLRHGNLACLLAYCDEDQERILVYPFFEKKSLDIYIFGTRVVSFLSEFISITKSTAFHLCICLCIWHYDRQTRPPCKAGLEAEN